MKFSYPFELPDVPELVTREYTLGDWIQSWDKFRLADNEDGYLKFLKQSGQASSISDYVEA